MRRFFQRFDHIQPFPRQIDVRAAEVAVSGGLPVNGAAQVKPADDCVGAHVENLLDQLGDFIAR